MNVNYRQCIYSENSDDLAVIVHEVIIFNW